VAEFPETRISLILRLAQRDDVQAWQEFCELYAPILYRMCIAKGLQTADAEDVTQDILFAVARAAERFEPDQARARFRTWLCCIARNLMADYFAGLAKRPLSQALSDSWLDSLVDAPAVEQEFDSRFGIEYRRAVFELAARRVRERVSHLSWQAFYATSVEHRNLEQVAKELHISLGSLYVARCRVLKMLRSEVQNLEQSLDSLEHVQ